VRIMAKGSALAVITLLLGMGD